MADAIAEVEAFGDGARHAPSLVEKLTTMGTARRTEVSRRSSLQRRSSKRAALADGADDDDDDDAPDARGGLLALLRRPTWAARHLTLALGANLFTGRGVARLLKRLDAACVDVAPTLRHLRVLDLSFCRFRALDATLLAEAVVGADELRVATLKLTGAKLGDAGVAALARALSAGLDARKNLARGGAGDGEVAGLHHDCALRHLDVAANGFGLAGTRALARCLAAHLDVFTSLVLDGNAVGSRGAALLAAACADPMGLERPCFAYLGLNDAQIGGDGAKHLLVGLVERSVTIDVGLEGNADVSSAVRHEINLQHALVKYSRNRAMGLSIETPQLQSRGLATGAARFSPRHTSRSLSGAPTRAKSRAFVDAALQRAPAPARGSESDGDLSPRSSGASSSRVSFNPTI